LGLRRVTADRLELLLETGEACHRLGLGPLVRAGHPLLGGAPLGDDPVETTGREDPLVGGDGEVAGPGVLGQVADPAARRDVPARGPALPGEDLRQGGLAGPVATDAADAVPGGHPEGRVLEEDPGAGTQLDPGGGDHGWFSWRVEGRSAASVGRRPPGQRIVSGGACRGGRRAPATKSRARTECRSRAVPGSTLVT